LNKTGSIQLKKWGK